MYKDKQKPTGEIHLVKYSSLREPSDDFVEFKEFTTILFRQNKIHRFLFPEF